MNTHHHFHASQASQKAAALNQYPRRRADAQNAITEPQIEFLNSYACQHISPYSPTFWPDLTASLACQSWKAARLPRAPYYRHALEPYLLRRVHMTAGRWEIKSYYSKGFLRLVLYNVRLTHVHGGALGAAPNITLSHMNVFVSTAWFNRVIPNQNEALVLDGVLHQYASSKGTRNISLMPVLVMPMSRELPPAQPCAVRPGPTVCPGLAA